MRIIRIRIETPNISKNAHFTKKAIKDLIQQGRKITLKTQTFKEQTELDELRY